MSFLNPRHREFAVIFARLCHDEIAKGNQNPRCGRTAALLAGYGSGSWHPNLQIQTADVMFNKIVKRPEVVEYLKELGIERVGKRWQAIKRAG